MPVKHRCLANDLDIYLRIQKGDEFTRLFIIKCVMVVVQFTVKCCWFIISYLASETIIHVRILP